MAKKNTKPADALDTNPKEKEKEKKFSRLSQADVPSMTLDKALAVAKTIVDNYAGKSATTLQVARALGVQPTTGAFRMLCGASVAYGLTKGSYNSEEISLEQLGKRILRPVSENDDLNAKVEAFLKPRVIKEFFQKYNGAAVPREDIAKNVLEDMGVPGDRLKIYLKL